MSELKDLAINPEDYLKDAIFRIPGVVNPFEYTLRSGSKDYYFDIDPLLNNPLECGAMVRWYVNTIERAKKEHGLGGSSLLFMNRGKIGFGGSTGVLRLAGAIGIMTGMRQYVYPEKAPKTNLIFVSDFCTTGMEEREVIWRQRTFGGEVTDLVVFGLDTESFKVEEFEKLSVRVHHLIEGPKDLDLERWAKS